MVALFRNKSSLRRSTSRNSAKDAAAELLGEEMDAGGDMAAVAGGVDIGGCGGGGGESEAAGGAGGAGGADGAGDAGDVGDAATGGGIGGDCCMISAALRGGTWCVLSVVGTTAGSTGSTGTAAATPSLLS